MTQNSNKRQKPQILKLTRDSEFKSSFDVVFDEELDKNYECQEYVGEFLYDLFCCIEHFGIFVEEGLIKGETHFSMDSYFGDVIAGNKIRLRDEFELVDHEMNLNEFLRVNNEYYKLSKQNAKHIIFRIIDEKVVLKGFWENF